MFTASCGNAVCFCSARMPQERRIGMASEKEKSISPETESEPEVSASEKTVPAEINHRHHRPHYRSSNDQKKTIRFRKRKAFQLKTEPVPAKKLPEEKPEEKKDLPAEEAKPAEEVKPEAEIPVQPAESTADQPEKLGAEVKETFQKTSEALKKGWDFAKEKGAAGILAVKTAAHTFRKKQEAAAEERKKENEAKAAQLKAAEEKKTDESVQKEAAAALEKGIEEVKEKTEAGVSFVKKASEELHEKYEKAEEKEEAIMQKEPPESFNRKSPGHIVLVIFLFLVAAAAVGGCAVWTYYESLLDGCPELDLTKRENYSTASVIYDADGNWVADYGTNENIEWAGIDEIPKQLKDAFVAIEDQRFYVHNGIDLKRLTGAVIGQITHNANYGASTLTQQLVRNVFLTQNVSYQRKAQEIHLSLQLEKVMSKDEILEWYLNIIYLGDSNYGVKVAAQDYFGKDLDQLSLRECAMIAGLVQSPNEYNPRTNYNSGDMSVTNWRTDNVLYAMYKTGKISEEQYSNALSDTVAVRTSSDRFKLYDYPLYVEYAVEDVAEQLLKQEGKEATTANLDDMKRQIRNAGYQIYTALDTSMMDTMQDAITNFSNYPRTEDGTEVEASAVIMDQHTGRVLAMVGGREETTEPEGFNRAVDSTQPVGSSFKPLAVYAPALESGDYPGTTVLDVQTSIYGYGGDNSYPNGDYINGPITMRRALELSHNIPAARFLLEHVGIDRSFSYLTEEGFDPSHLDKTAAGLALGASSVTTLEMTAGYACLANGGVYIAPHAYITVKDRFGNLILDESGVETHQVFSESTAWLVTDMMETNMTEGLGVKAHLDTVKSCGKTGTHEHQVISFGGYTPYYTSFLRVSADNYAYMTNSSSYYQAAPLWKSYMDPISEGGDPDKEIQEKTAEELGIQKYKVCTESGMLAQSWCPSAEEYAAPNNAPTELCTGHSHGSWSGEGDDTEYQAETDYSNGWWDENGTFHPYTGWWDENGVWHDQ